MSSTINLRMTKRSQPIFNKVQELVKKSSAKQFSAIVLDLLELGLDSYNSGKRILDGEVVEKLQSNDNIGERTIYSVFNEVAESLYSSLAGNIANLTYFEEKKQRPNKDRLEYYQLIRQALWAEKFNFSTFSDREIKNRSSEISPILKSFSGDALKDATVVKKNQDFFDKLIARAGLAH